MIEPDWTSIVCTQLTVTGLFPFCGLFPLPVWPTLPKSSLTTAILTFTDADFVKFYLGFRCINRFKSLKLGFLQILLRFQSKFRPDSELKRKARPISPLRCAAPWHSVAFDEVKSCFNLGNEPQVEPPQFESRLFLISSHLKSSWSLATPPCRSYIS